MLINPSTDSDGEIYSKEIYVLTEYVLFQLEAKSNSEIDDSLSKFVEADCNV